MSLGSKYINDTGSQISSQHPYAEKFIGKPHVWTVDVTNQSEVREAVRAILRTEVVNTQRLRLKALHLVHPSPPDLINSSTV